MLARCGSVAGAAGAMPQRQRQQQQQQRMQSTRSSQLMLLPSSYARAQPMRPVRQCRRAPAAPLAALITPALAAQRCHGCCPLQRRPPLRLRSGAATAGGGSSASPTPEDSATTPPGSGFLSSLYKSLRDFGMGRSSLAEGGLGLFTLMGGVLTAGLLLWVRGAALRAGRPYSATIEFPLACGITVGTPVRIRGVAVGSVLSVRPSLDKVEVMVEVNDAGTVIPANSIVEANQSGLIAEPLVDITPQLPLPHYTASPLEVDACRTEGAIVCAGGRIVGQQGVALDDMVYVMTRMARQMEEEGVDKFFAAASSATAALDEARPLLEEAAALTRELTPLLAELRSGGLVGHLEALTEAAAGAAEELQALQGAVLTDDNVRALRGAVLTLCRTLEHVESLSADAALLSRDAGVQRNLRTLITALSRIIEE